MVQNHVHAAPFTHSCRESNKLNWILYNLLNQQIGSNIWIYIEVIRTRTFHLKKLKILGFGKLFKDNSHYILILVWTSHWTSLPNFATKSYTQARAFTLSRSTHFCLHTHKHGDFQIKLISVFIPTYTLMATSILLIWNNGSFWLTLTEDNKMDNQWKWMGPCCTKSGWIPVFKRVGNFNKLKLIGTIPSWRKLNHKKKTKQNKKDFLEWNENGFLPPIPDFPVSLLEFGPQSSAPQPCLIPLELREVSVISIEGWWTCRGWQSMDQFFNSQSQTNMYEN